MKPTLNNTRTANAVVSVTAPCLCDPTTQAESAGHKPVTAVPVLQKARKMQPRYTKANASLKAPRKPSDLLRKQKTKPRCKY